jgi:RNA polymerase sigma-70 factor (ECF subfamily)
MLEIPRGESNGVPVDGRAGDRPMSEAVVEILADHRVAVRDFVAGLVRNRALTEDLTQETFVRAQRSKSSRRGESSLKTWLIAIALNLVRDHFRSTRRAAETASDDGVLEALNSGEDIEHDLLEREMSECIGEHLGRLPSPYLEVVALYDRAGLSHGEIASALDISQANSRVLLHRGRAALREILESACVLSFDADNLPCERRPSPADDSD